MIGHTRLTLKQTLEQELDASLSPFALSDAQLLAIAGGAGGAAGGTEPVESHPTGACVTGPYNPDCGTKRTVCGACKTLPSTTQWCD
ncbi:MAG: hypothetical protein ACO1SV_08880 [Fimbriimonas sp.]